MEKETSDVNKSNPGYVKNITIRGLRSIKKLEKFELRKTNVLIGANGAGKSNFLEAFNLIGSVVQGRVRDYGDNYSSLEGLFFGGSEITSEIELGIFCGEWEHSSKLKLSQDDGIIATQNRLKMAYQQRQLELAEPDFNELESIKFGTIIDRSEILTRRALVNNTWKSYQFNERSQFSRIRRRYDIRYDYVLDSRCINIAPLLKYMKDNHPDNYQFFLGAVQTVLPTFEDFLFKLQRHGDRVVTTNLSWSHKKFDFPMQSNHLSSGSLRFIALAACLLQPNPPNTIIIDEPELGLHPEAIEIFADLVKNRMQKSQVIIATQSPTLVDMFQPEDIVTVSDGEEGSEFKRLESKDLDVWLEDYSLGQLWLKNVVKASP